jgi:hypothetical protein
MALLERSRCCSAIFDQSAGTEQTEESSYISAYGHHLHT